MVCYTSDGLYCSLDKVCEPLIAPDQPCLLSEACQPGYSCEVPTGIGEGACRPENQIGDPCTDRCSGNLICQNNACAPVPVGYDNQCEGDFD